MGAIRFFLAIVVALAHWRIIVLKPVFTMDMSPEQDRLFQLGFNAGYAVLFFYMISGFLITYTLTTNYEDSITGALKFYRNRAVRIFSVYWPMIVLCFITYPPGFSEFNAAKIADKFTNIFLIGVDWRVAFATYPKPHFEASVVGLHQAWTLGAELGFYMLAPLLVRSWKATAALLFGSLALRMTFVATIGYDEVRSYYFAPSIEVQQFVALRIRDTRNVNVRVRQRRCNAADIKEQKPGLGSVRLDRLGREL